MTVNWVSTLTRSLGDYPLVTSQDWRPEREISPKIALQDLVPQKAVELPKRAPIWGSSPHIEAVASGAVGVAARPKGARSKASERRIGLTTGGQ